MIELHQQVGEKQDGRGGVRRVVFGFDAVYQVTPAGREKLGFVERRTGAAFVPIVPLADVELARVMVALNAARDTQGLFGPACDPNSRPPTDEAYRDAIREIASPDEGDDDE